MSATAALVGALGTCGSASSDMRAISLRHCAVPRSGASRAAFATAAALAVAAARAATPACRALGCCFRGVGTARLSFRRGRAEADSRRRSREARRISVWSRAAQAQRADDLSVALDCRGEGEQTARDEFDQRAGTVVAADRDAVQRGDGERIACLRARQCSPRRLGAQSNPDSVRSRPEASRKWSVASTRRSIPAVGDVLSAADIEPQLCRLDSRCACELVFIQELDLVDQRVTGVGAEQRLARLPGDGPGFRRAAARL